MSDIRSNYKMGSKTIETYVIGITYKAGMLAMTLNNSKPKLKWMKRFLVRLVECKAKVDTIRKKKR